MVADPFASEVRRERLSWLVGFLALCLLLGVLVWLALRTDFRGAATIEGVIVRVGTYAHETGDLPILTVRLDDGSTRQLRARRAAIIGCAKGSTIELLQQAGRFRVGPRGCRQKR